MPSSPSGSTIESRHNAAYKEWCRYVAFPEEETCPWIAVEGLRQIHTLSSRFPIELLLFCETGTWLDNLSARARRSVRLSPPLLNSLSSLKNPAPVLAFFPKPRWTWEDLTEWVFYLDRLQDPGNLGTLLRTAAATGIFTLAMSPGTVSCFNAKAVRASSAALFSVPFLEGVEPSDLTDRGYTLWAADSRRGDSLFSVRFKPPLALLLGNEGAGLEPSRDAAAHRRVHIPMSEATKSLNAAVAGSILAYEVLRQQAEAG